MNTLVERTIGAHGGLNPWNELESITVHLDGGGALWGLKGHPDMVEETNVTVGTRSQWASHHPFLADRARTRFEPHSVALERENGELVEELKEPRASFAGHGLETPWSKLQLAYFAGYAMWTYLNLPFLLARPVVMSEEGAPWQENGEVWRPLKITYPDSIAGHTREQIAYYGQDGLLRRHAYTVDVLGGASGLNYAYDYRNVNGIMVPTTRRVYPSDADTQKVPEPLLVAIDIREIAFIEARR